MMENYHFILIGGDKRYHRLAEILKEKKYSISVYGMNSKEFDVAYVDPVKGSFSVPNNRKTIIILPLPLSKPAGFVNNPLGNAPIFVSDLPKLIPKGSLVLSGPLPPCLQDDQNNQWITHENLLKLTSFQHNNSIATAEGAIMHAIKKSARNIQGSNCLVLGFGCCGKAIAKRLSGLFADSIIVTGRREDTRKEAISMGYTYVPTYQISQVLSSCDFLFNTIPSKVLLTEQLKKIASHCILIDIASAPGGWAHDEARELGLESALYPGLPGKISPYSSGEYLYDAILEIIEKKESEFNKNGSI